MLKFKIQIYLSLVFRKKTEKRGGAAFFEGFPGDGFGIGCQCLTAAGSALALVPTGPPSLPPAAQGAAPSLPAAAQSAAFGPGHFGGVFGAVAAALTALSLAKLKLAGPDQGAGAGAPLLAEPVSPAACGT